MLTLYRLGKMPIQSISFILILNLTPAPHHVELTFVWYLLSMAMLPCSAAKQTRASKQWVMHPRGVRGCANARAKKAMLVAFSTGKNASPPAQMYCSRRVVSKFPKVLVLQPWLSGSLPVWYVWQSDSTVPI